MTPVTGVVRSLSTAVAAACLVGLTVASGEAAGSGAPPARVAAAPHAHQHESAPLSPGELRVRLEQLLGHHSVLTDRLARARLRGDADFAQSANAALVKNTADVRDLIASVYGDDAARQFADVWASHIRHVATYATALDRGDRAEMRRAEQGLDEYAQTLGAFLSEATGGKAPAATVRRGLRTHTQHLLDQAEAYAAEDYGRAYALGRTGYRHTFELAKTLAAGIAQRDGAALPPNFASRQRELQAALGLLLGEHVELAVDVKRAGVGNWPDFDAAATVFNDNTRDLTAAMESVFGARSAERFLSLWSDHIDVFVRYTSALAAEDAPAQESTRRDFEQFNREFSAFLRTATNGRLAAPALAREFREHERMLLQQIDAYAAGDYTTAHDLTYDAYAHMFTLADALAGAIGANVRAGSPRGGAETGARHPPMLRVDQK